MAKMATTKQKQKKDFKGFARSMKWLAGLLAGSVLALSLVIITVWVAGVDTSNVSPISKLEITGQKYTTANEISQQLKAIEDKGFFSIDMQQVEENLQALPWVKAVQLRKVWPEQLKIVLIEHKPLAFWGANGVVSVEGQVLYPQILPQAGWVGLSGPDNLAKDLTGLYEQFKKPLTGKALAIESMHLSDRGALSINFDTGLQVLLGKADFEERVARLLVNIENLKAHKVQSLAKIDLRYQNGFAASWYDDEQTKQLTQEKIN